MHKHKYILFVLVKLVSCSQFGGGVQHLQLSLWKLKLCQLGQYACSLYQKNMKKCLWVFSTHFQVCISCYLSVSEIRDNGVGLNYYKISHYMDAHISCLRLTITYLDFLFLNYEHPFQLFLLLSS